MSRFDNWKLDINAITLQQAEQYLDEFDIIINTTSAGLDNNKESVIRLNQLSPNTLVSDIIYIPYKTSFYNKLKRRVTLFIMV